MKEVRQAISTLFEVKSRGKNLFKIINIIDLKRKTSPQKTRKYDVHT